MRENVPPESALSRYRGIIDDWEAFIDALYRPLPVCVWSNTLRTDPHTVQIWLLREGFDPHPLEWYPGAFKLPAGVAAGNRIPFQAGLYHVQEEVSLLPAKLLGVLPGERVLDLCAAPGNKTAQLSVDMRNEGTLIANDLLEERLHVVHTTMTRLGLINISTTVGDAAGFRTGEPFDRILVDGPCSCEGTSRKQKNVLRKDSRENACRMAYRLEPILRNAVELCRPGGRIVYSTCTYAPEENEQVVDNVLRWAGKQLHIVPCDIPGLVYSEGITSWEGSSFLPDLRKALRLWPHQNDSGGFFTAVLEKTL